MARSGTKKRTILFIIELLVLLVLLGGLFVYGQISTKMNKIDTQELDADKVIMNEDIVSAEKLSGYTNIALFGIDSRDSAAAEYKGNSDTMMVASINNETKEVKLVSIYRDTMLNIGEGQFGSDSYEKCNAAYAFGGPEQAISMLNTNLDLNISEYATVDFNALVAVIDCMGGLDIEMTGAEVEHMNNYCVETSEVTGKEYTPIPRPADDAYVDVYHLNGVQATSYARIRYTAGLDFERTERQRLVLQKLAEKAKKSSLPTLSKIMDEVFPMVKTSLSKEEIFTMGANMLSYDFGDTTGFPFHHYEADIPKKGDVVVPTELDNNVQELHKFLFDEENYTVSETVRERSDVTVSISGYGYNTETGEVTVGAVSTGESQY